MEKILIALGGNALESKSNNNLGENKIIIKKTVKEIIKALKLGYHPIITYGNGPQIGKIIRQQEISRDMIPVQPIDVCGAMSQALIGYNLKNELENELRKEKMNMDVSTVLTRVLVNKNDIAFENPSKPIGSFYNIDEKIKMEKEGYIIKKDSNRGYRRVVPSPKPLDILEISTIKKLVSLGNIVICSGGGGIPVIEENGEIKGVSAVVDKDKTSSLLARKLNIRKFIILTEVDHVYLDFNKKNKRKIANIESEKLRLHIKNDEFAEGSMLPKVEASIDFVENNKENIAIITSIANLKEALELKVGTIIRD